MIKLSKRRASPQGLKSSAVKRAQGRVRDQVTKGETKEFAPLWLADDVRGPLYDDHNKKCCYCERRRGLKREGDVEHFRPKARPTDDADHPGYWWLAYTWKNLLFSCKTCNETFKRNHFPISGERARKPQDSLTKELPILLDPAVDDPKKHLHYDWEHGKVPLASIVGSNERGRKTVEILGLNSLGLDEERGSILLNLSGLVAMMNHAIFLSQDTLRRETAERIKNETAPTKEFAGFRREYFRKANLGKFVPWD